VFVALSGDRLQSLGLQTWKTPKQHSLYTLCISISVSVLMHLNGVSSQDLHDSLTDIWTEKLFAWIKNKHTKNVRRSVISDIELCSRHTDSEVPIRKDWLRTSECGRKRETDWAKSKYPTYPLQWFYSVSCLLVLCPCHMSPINIAPSQQCDKLLSALWRTITYTF